MNLADAIRKAAVAPAVTEAISAGLHPFSSLHGHADSAPLIDVEQLTREHHEIPEEKSVHVEGSGLSTTSGPGLIRLELFLPPEQVNRLVRSVTAAHHSVLTLREAASHLRISPARLEEMAAEHRVPAFKVDGRWRFSRSRLDEWVANEWEKENAS